MKDIHATTVKWCQSRVGPLEVGMCPVYANVAVMAMSDFIDAPGVAGSTGMVCAQSKMFIDQFKGAEIDLKLIEEALPEAARNSLLEKGSMMSKVMLGATTKE